MKGIFLILLLTFSGFSFAEKAGFKTVNFIEKDRDNTEEIEDYDEKYFSISEVRLKDMGAFGAGITPPVNFPVPLRPNNGGALNIITTVDRLIAVGMKLWKIVDGGRPVITDGLKDNFSVLPKTENGTLDFGLFTGWSRPVTRSYKVDYVNGYGSKVISFVYNVSYLYGGKYMEKGSYLSGLAVRASRISVSWGFDFEAQSELLSIVNHGTKSEPLAGATVKIDYRAKSIIKDIISSTAFHVTADGALEPLY
jgi:hypothetical protein